NQKHSNIFSPTFQVSDIESARSDVKSARSDVKSARSDVECARNDVESARSDVDSARSDFESARSDVESARTKARTKSSVLPGGVHKKLRIAWLSGDDMNRGFSTQTTVSVLRLAIKDSSKFLPRNLL
ncbi:hypothetical protein BgiMline_024453, partial [Biomphalaria glabrata]